jgi:hypothetical protein
MSEVRKWLDSIGLARYAYAFETNDLDFDLLRQVDDQLLKDIGVSSAGHRLRIAMQSPSWSQERPLTARLRRLCRPCHRYRSQPWSNQKASAGILR